MTVHPHHDRAAAPALAAPVAAMIFEGRAARVHRRGDPLRYRWGEELRDAEELARIVSQLPGKPVVFLHPVASAENKDGIIARGAEADIVGTVISARLDGDYAVVQVAITDQRTINKIEEKKLRELSLGYACRTDAAQHQRNTVVDHLALVWEARCGGTCELRADCACESEDSIRHEAPDRQVQESCMCFAKSLDIGQHANHMPQASETDATKGLAELQQKLADANGQLAAHQARADQAEKDRDEAKARADQAEKDRDLAKMEAFNARKDAERAQGEVDAARTRADQAEKGRDEAKARADQAEQTAAEKARADAAEDLEARISAKVALVAEATPIIGTNEKGEPVEVAKMSDRAIKVAVVFHVDGDDLEKMDPKPSNDFISGVYAGAVKRHKQGSTSRQDVARTIADLREDAASKQDQEPTTGRAAERRSLDAQRARLRDGWKTPTTERGQE